jgi:hypothetical protein
MNEIWMTAAGCRGQPPGIVLDICGNAIFRTPVGAVCRSA